MINEKDVKIISRDVEETIALGQSLGKTLIGGEVVALVGTLGTGKTHLIKGIALGLDVDESVMVTSPTFTLINEYEGRMPMYHIDAYRLENAAHLEVLGFDEICAAGGVVVVEWADKVWPLVQAYKPIEVYLEHRGENERSIRIKNLPGYVVER